MKILYILYFNIEKTQFLGVRKKILSQIHALEKLGHNVDFAYCKEDELILKSNNKMQHFSIKRGFTHYRGSIQKKLSYVTKYEKYDIAYIRYPGSIDISMLNTFKVLKRNGLNILLEMPTYPIGGELIERLKGLLKQGKFISLAFYFFVYLIHRICSRQINRYIKLIVTFMPYDFIWNTPTIIIDNGVRIEDYHPVKNVPNSPSNIVLIGVANIAPWHGYDRVIDGLWEYYNSVRPAKYNVIFNIIGDSPLVNELKDKVRKLKMDDYVKFLGLLEGEELEKQYQYADIAVSSLGMHRINVLHGSTLKTKEYCAYGVPFILGYYEKTITGEFPYALQVQAEDKPVSIEKIIDFYKRVRVIPDYEKKCIHLQKNITIGLYR